MNLSELGQEQLLLKAVELAEKNQQLEADLAAIRAALKQTIIEKEELRTDRDSWKYAGEMVQKDLDQEKADAKASKMMLKQVCEERDKYKDSHFSLMNENLQLRMLLRDCPLLIERPRVWADYLSGVEAQGWIERAKEEALKL